MKRRLRESAGIESWPLTASDRDRLISFDESRKDPSLRRLAPLLLLLRPPLARTSISVTGSCERGQRILVQGIALIIVNYSGH